MGLYAVALQDIRINRSLRQELDTLQLSRLFLKNADKLRADDFALLLGLLYPLQLIQETVHRVHIHQVGIHLIAEHLHYLLRLSLSEKAVVHVDAYQLLSDRLNQKRGYHGGIHASGQSQQHLLIAYLLLDSLHLLFDKSLRQFTRRDTDHVFGTFVVIHCLISSFL